jgi:hypothetical protein
MQLPVLCSIFERQQTSASELTTAASRGWVPEPSDNRNGNLTFMQSNDAGASYRPRNDGFLDDF